MKGFALTLVLKQRYKRTQKWPIEKRCCVFNDNSQVIVRTRVSNLITISKALKSDLPMISFLHRFVSLKTPARFKSRPVTSHVTRIGETLKLAKYENLNQCQ